MLKSLGVAICSLHSVPGQVHVKRVVPVSLLQPSEKPSEPVVRLDVIGRVLHAARPCDVSPRLVGRRVVANVLAGFDESHRAAPAGTKHENIHGRCPTGLLARDQRGSAPKGICLESNEKSIRLRLSSLIHSRDRTVLFEQLVPAIFV